jgi:hypothetical protein
MRDGDGTKPIEMTKPEYDSVRSNSTHFHSHSTTRTPRWKTS